MRPHRRQPTRRPRPWDSPGKNTGVGCHFLLQCIKVKVKSLSRVRLLATPWTAAHQAPPSMGFSRQKYWSGINHASGLNFTVSSLSPFLLFCFLFNLHTIHLLNFFSYKIEYIYSGSDSKESAAMWETLVGSSGWEVPWSRKWQPTQVLLRGKLNGQRSLVVYSPWGHEESAHDLATKQPNSEGRFDCSHFFWHIINNNIIILLLSYIVNHQ